MRRHYGVTDRRFKLIHFYEPDVDEWELYDLQFDPWEINNVYDNPAYARVKQRLTAELERQRTALGVPAEDPPESNRTFPERTRIRTPG